MICQLLFLKGFKDSNIYFQQMAKAERLYGMKNRLLFLFLLSILLFTISGAYGIGTAHISTQLIEVSSSVFEWNKAFFVIGRLIVGLLYPAIILLLPSLIFWLLGKVTLQKLVAMQSFVLIILLIESGLHTLLAIFAGLEWYSSPFSLGVIAQYITTNDLLIYFCGSISLFKLWSMILQYKGLRAFTTQKGWVLWGVILFVNSLFWILTAFLAYIDFHVLLF